MGKKRRNAGISMLALVVVIIVIIILAAIAINSFDTSVGQATHAKFSHELSEIQDKVTIKREENKIDGVYEGVEDKGFTKVYVENAPSNFVSFDEDSITGYLVDFKTIKEKEIQTGREILRSDQVTFGKNDVYIYDEEGKVYYVRGWQNGDGNLHYRVDTTEDTNKKLGPQIESVTCTLTESNTKMRVEAVVKEKYGGTLTVTGGGQTAKKVGSNTYEFLIEKNGTLQIVARESNGGISTSIVTISGIIQKEEYTIRFYANGGGGAPGNQVKKEGETLILSTEIPSKKNYVFKGWATTKDATEAEYQPGGEYSLDKSIDLYAVWESHVHKWDEGSITVVATCTTKGEKIYTCSECNQTKVEAISALGHVYGVDYITDTDNHWQACIRCSKDSVPQGHVWDENFQCSTCKYQKVDIEISGNVTITGDNKYGNTLNVDVSKINPADCDLTFQWYTNSTNSMIGGNPINGATGAAYQIENEAIGKYIYVEVTASKLNYVTRTFSDITDSMNNQSEIVTKLVLNKPQIMGTYTYNGKEQTATLIDFDGKYMNISKNTRINAGTQNVVVSLRDTENYEWEDGTSKDVELTWTIEKKDVTTVWTGETSFVYDGNSKAPIASATSGVTGETLKITTNVAINVGEYEAIAQISSVTGGQALESNYNLTNTKKVFTIKEASMSGSINIVGEALYGATLTVDTSLIVPTECKLTYKWYSNDVNSTTGGEEISTDTACYISSDLAGKYIYVEVTATKENYTSKVYSAITSTQASMITISYNANGGNIGNVPSIQTKTYGIDLKLTEEKAVSTKARNVFAGWATSKADADAGVITYKAGATYTNNESITLYAVYLSDLIPSIANAPILGTNMQAVSWESGAEAVSQEYTDGMYAYVMGDGVDDTKQAKWANAKSQDDSYWVWIPRFAYKKIYYIDNTKTEHSETSTEHYNYSVIFLDGTTNQYRNEVTSNNVLPAGYSVSSAFSNNGTELSGFWISKYELAREDSVDGINWESTKEILGGANVKTTNAGNDTGDIRVVSKPNMTSWIGISAATASKNASGMDKANNSHLMLNAEFEATYVLAVSEYGRNGENIVLDSNKQTGGSENTTTTGNETGVYDLLGGYWEYTGTNVGASDLSNMILIPAENNYITNTTLSNPYEISKVIYRGLDVTGEQMNVESIPVDGSPDLRISYRAAFGK